MRNSDRCRRNWRRDASPTFVVVVHYDDLPEKDVTTLHGIPVTTAVRTVIDIAPDLDDEHLHRVLVDALSRQLFTVDELQLRLSEPDMLHRPGTARLRQVLTRFGGAPSERRAESSGLAWWTPLPR
jgi:hypothetical protein